MHSVETKLRILIFSQAIDMVYDALVMLDSSRKMILPDYRLM